LSSSFCGGRADRYFVQVRLSQVRARSSGFRHAYTQAITSPMSYIRMLTKPILSARMRRRSVCRKVTSYRHVGTEGKVFTARRAEQKCQHGASSNVGIRWLLKCQVGKMTAGVVVGAAWPRHIFLMLETRLPVPRTFTSFIHE
jgi:hypothetical protein